MGLGSFFDTVLVAGSFKRALLEYNINNELRWDNFVPGPRGKVPRHLVRILRGDGGTQCKSIR